MIKAIIKNVKIGIIIMMMALCCIVKPEVPDVKAAVEGGTDIWLRIQTKEIDKDDIPDDRIVDLDISIENNPKIDVLGFIVEKDNRLNFDGLNVIKNIHQGISNTMNYNFENADNLIYNKVIFGVFPDEEDGVFAQIRIKLPDNVDINDFYSVNILSSYDSAVPCIGIISPESKIIYGSEYFGGFEDGGIRITDNTSVQQVQNYPDDSQPQPDQQSLQPVQEQNNRLSTKPNNVDQQPTSSITTPRDTVSKTVPSQTSSVTNIKATKTTSVSTSLITEYIDTEVTDIIQTDITDEQTSVSDKSNGKTKIIICVSIAVMILTALIYFLYRYRKKDNT